MPFYRIGEPGADMWAHINFGRKNGPLQCVAPRFEKDNPQMGEFCRRPSVALCDGPRVGANPHVTCDRPMCELHRTKHPTKANTDYCPAHATLVTTSREPGEEG